MPKFYNSDSSLTAYALACGHVQSDETVLENFTHYRVTLSGGVGAYDIDVYPIGSAPDWVQPSREWVEREGGSKIIAGWTQFLTLTEARKHLRKVMRAKTYAEVISLSLEAMN